MEFTRDISYCIYVNVAAYSFYSDQSFWFPVRCIHFWLTNTQLLVKNQIRHCELTRGDTYMWMQTNN